MGAQLLGRRRYQVVHNLFMPFDITCWWEIKVEFPIVTLIIVADSREMVRKQELFEAPQSHNL